MARWVRSGLSVSGSFVCRCLIILTVLRFHIPLIEPDVRISRIRLPEEASRFRSREAALPLGKPDKSKRGVQALGRKSPEPRPRHFMFVAQPLTQPFAGMPLDGPIGFAG